MFFCTYYLFPLCKFYSPLKLGVVKRDYLFLVSQHRRKYCGVYSAKRLKYSAKRLKNVYKCFGSDAELKVTYHKNIGLSQVFSTEHTAKTGGTLLPCFYYS